jgi:hypothetical protein
MPDSTTFLVGGLGIEGQKNGFCEISFGGHGPKWNSASHKQQQLTSRKNDFEVLLPPFLLISYEKSGENMSSRWQKCTLNFWVKVMVKVKQSHYRP